MKEIIRELNDDILYDTLRSTFGMLSLLVSVFATVGGFICAMLAMSSSSTTPFEIFMRQHQWLPISIFAVIIVGWAFYIVYQANREEWSENDSDHALTYTMWYIWYFLTFSWLVMLPACLVAVTFRRVIVAGVIRLIKSVSKPKRGNAEIIEQYDILLRK